MLMTTKKEGARVGELIAVHQLEHTVRSKKRKKKKKSLCFDPTALTWHSAELWQKHSDFTQLDRSDKNPGEDLSVAEVMQICVFATRVDHQ